MGSAKKTTTVNQTQNETATTRPNLPDNVSGGLGHFADTINLLNGADPYQYVAPPSSLQQQAWGQASNLGGWQAGTGAAFGLAANTAGAGANTAQAFGYEAPTIDRTQLGPASTYDPQMFGGAQADPFATAGPVNLGEASTYQPAQLGAAGQANAEGYTASLADRVALGPVAMANSQGYDAATAAAERGTASSLLENLSSYMNPATQAMVDTTLADFDVNSGRVRAAQAANAAKAGAFGGSRFAIREAQTEGELARARASADANLRGQAFDRATAMSDSDAARRTSVSMGNAQLGTQANIANAGFSNDARRFTADAANQASIFNSGQQNQFTLNQGQMDQQRNLFNSDATNTASAFGANARNAADIFNTGQRNQFDMAQFGANNDAAQFGANARNQYGLAQGQINSQLGMFNASAANENNLANAGFRQQAGLAGMDAANQARQFGANAQNQYGLAQYQGDQQRALAQADLFANQRQFNTAAANQNSMFNAGQQDNALARRLQAAGLMGDLSNNYAGNQRADTALLGEMGNQQWQMDQMYRQAPLDMMKLQSGLWSNYPWQAFGQTVTGNSTTNGKTTEKSNPGLFNQLLGIASIAAPFIPGNIFGGK